VAVRAEKQASQVWGELDPEALSESWQSIGAGDRLLVAVSVAQLTAAASADPYVAAAVATQGVTEPAEAAIRPASWAGVASDGRDLDTLLFQPVLTTLGRIGQGLAPAEAHRVGGSALSTIVRTQVADAGRSATGVAMQARSAVKEYVRMLTPPSCSRCVILAGKRFKAQEAFDRHERCDCVNVPAVEDVADDIMTDPKAYFESLDATDQDRYFTQAGAQAIRDGADMNQVVNARRGAAGLSQPGRLTAAEQKMLRGGRDRGYLQRVDVYGRQVYVTTAGTTRRGVAGKKLGAWSDDAVKVEGVRNRRARTPRLMPEACYELAGGDREEALRLLRRFGYVLD
jgi:hypothetical protein